MRKNDVEEKINDKKNENKCFFNKKNSYYTALFKATVLFKRLGPDTEKMSVI